jgi:hypothetical protein
VVLFELLNARIHDNRLKKNRHESGTVELDVLYSVRVEVIKRQCIRVPLAVGRNITQTQVHSAEQSRVEAGSNTSTVTLRIVGGDEKGSLESETVNYGHESHGSRTRKCLLHWQGPAAIVNDRPVLSSERAPHINKPAIV